MLTISRSISRSSISMAVSGIMSSFFRVRLPDRTAFSSGLQIPIHEVDLLETAKALADVLRPDLADALDRLQLRVGGGEDLIQPAELADDVLHHELRQPWDAPQDPVAGGRDGIVQRVNLAVITEQLRQAPEVEQILVREPRDAVQRDGEGVVHRLGEIVVQQRGLVPGYADHGLLELHLDEAAL